jgi:hypothetical protein
LVVKTPELTRPLRSLALRFSPFRALAELAGFAAPAGLQIQLKQGGSLNPEMPAMLGFAYGGFNPHACVVGALCKRDPFLPSDWFWLLPSSP